MYLVNGMYIRDETYTPPSPARQGEPDATERKPVVLEGEAPYSQERARGPAACLRETAGHRTVRLEETVHVGGVDVQAHHVREAGARSAEDRLEVVDRLAQLGTHVVGMHRPALVVHRSLPRAVDGASDALHLVGLDVAHLVLPRPAVDDPSLNPTPPLPLAPNVRRAY
jgi:hypothetical protein